VAGRGGWVSRRLQTGLAGLVSRNRLLYAIGLASGLANVVSQRVVGYTPTDYAPSDVERGVAHVLGIADRWQRTLDTFAPGENFVGKRVLELGPGQSLGTGLVLLARGASAYTAVDVFPLAQRSPPELYGALARTLGVDPSLAQQATFQIVRFPELEPLVGPFDIVVSNSTLEHVQDVPATFRALRRLVSGSMVHHVDARVHSRIQAFDPLNHLRFGRRTYRLMRYTGLPNRLLWEDYRRAAVEAGFHDTQFLAGRSASVEYLERARTQLAPALRNRADLANLTFTVFAR
jgi:hypothetical protein